jgi:WD40 repeat protein
MKHKLAKIVGAIAVLAAFLATPLAHSQEHVRLMPQLGVNSVESIAFSPDGRFVLTGSEDSMARLWDAATGQQLRSFKGHTSTVASVVFSPNGRTVLTGSYDGTARIWEVATGKQLESFKADDRYIHSVAFSPDGRFVLTGSADKTARLWDVATNRQIRAFEGHADEVMAVAFSPDGRSVLTGSKDNTARLWDAASGRQILSFERNVYGVDAVAFSPDGQFVLTGAGESARLWKAATGQQIRSFDGFDGFVESVAFSRDGRAVLIGSLDGTVQMRNSLTGEQIRFFGKSPERPDKNTETADQLFSKLDEVLDIRNSKGITSVAFSRDGRFVLAGSTDQKALMWDMASADQVRAFTGHTDEVTSLAFSMDGHFLLTGSSDKSARLWDTGTGEEIRSFLGHTKPINAVTISPDSHLVLTYGDTTVRLWNSDTGKQIRTFTGFNTAAFSPDGKSVLTGGLENTAFLSDTATGREIRSFKGPVEEHKSTDPRQAETDPGLRNMLTADVTAVAFSRDGAFVLTGTGSVVGESDNAARLWEVATGRQISAFKGHTQSITSVAISADGRFVLTGSEDKSARLWNASTGEQLVLFKGHTDRVTSVAFSPDGHSVLTGSWDNTARLWDAATGRQIRTFEGHEGWVYAVAFSPDGRFVLTGSEDTTTRLWDAATGKQLATLLSFENGGWAVTDNEGRYDSNDPDKTPGLVWVTDTLRPIELKQLKDNYYTPNLLASILKGQRLPDVKGLDLVPAPPELAIASPYRPENRHLSITVADQGGGVGRLVVSVNNRKVAVLAHPVAEHAAKPSTISVDLAAATIKPGENTISAYAYDAGNQIRSQEAIATFTVAANSKGLESEEDEAMEEDYKPQFYAIIIGTSTFPGNHKMDLLYPAHDAESIRTGLEIGASNLFGKENIHMRLLTTDARDEKDQPKKENIAAAFSDVMKNAKPTDVLLVYLSGHGINLHTEKDSYYYLTTDARGQEIETNPALRSLSTVSSVELNQWLGAKNMPLKEVLILDTCAAGAANEELLKLVASRDVPPDQRRAVEFLKEATGTIVLMGSAADKVSYEASKYGQGLLTYALLEGMRGRSIEEGSRLNVSRWFQNASEDVPQLALSIGGIQRPVIAAPSGRGFPVALLNPADQAKIPLAAIKPELVHLSCHDEDDNDPLGLAAVVREQLREISHPSARGSDTEPPIVYFDDMTDGPADSLIPKVVYSVSGTSVNLRLRIEQAGKIIKEERLNLASADKNALATAVAAKLVAMSADAPHPPANQ